METGFYDDIPELTYHADRQSLSVTGAKTLLKAPALFRYQQDHPVTSDYFDIGSAAHRLVLGVGPEIVSFTFPDWRTNLAQAARDDAREEGLIPLLEKDYQRVREMADALSSHRLAMRLLSDGRPEVSAYCLDEDTGVMRRGRLDWLGTNIITDYKTAASVEPKALAGRYGAVKKYGYDQQAAWYLDLCRDLGHDAKVFAFIFQAKEPPYLVTVARIDEADLWDARQANREALQRFRDCTASDLWPAYIRDDACAVLSLDQQTYQEEVIA